MKKSLLKISILLFAVACVPAFAISLPVTDYVLRDGSVYALSNDVNSNRVAIYDRSAEGRLVFRRFVPTGGKGSGGGLGNQGALALSQSGKWLLAVNPGSNSVSVFYVFQDFLLRTDTQASGGVRPVSVAIENDIVYVLNAGSDSLQGFRMNQYGQLQPITNSNTPLSSTGTGAAQVGFNRAGDLLVVTEKATNRVLSFPLDADGMLGVVNVKTSPAPTPFGFAFGRRDQLFVTEAHGGAAGASTLTSYAANANGALNTISTSEPDLQSAACWVVTTRDGHFAYVSNTGSDNISSYAISPVGALSVLGDGATTNTGSGSKPTDLALDRNSDHLYSLNPANGTISSFRISAEDGSLELIEVQSSHLPGSATGLVAR